MTTLYWHDYETWGATPSVDRPAQFAGVRTDDALNIISEPLMMYCQPHDDILPQPEASLITGITPQKARAEGLPEREFIARIHQEFMQPDTCGVGYNTLRFDDEITRYSLYRHFYDPYEREWRNGNSRWDIIDMVRTVYALRPEGIEWPMVDGVPSFRLELLTQANNISHGAAHDAYSDVEATIHFAKLIKQKQPGLYEYIWKLRKKNEVAKLIDLRQKKPLLHISSRFSAARGCAGLVVPLAVHPVNKNAIIAFDLSVDPGPLGLLSAEEIHQRVFTAESDLPEGQTRLPLKLIHLNKCPVLATTKLLDDANAKRLGIDKAQCENHWQKIKRLNIPEKLAQVYLMKTFDGSADPEAQLYEGFVNSQDKAVMTQLLESNDAEIMQHTFVFNDKRLNHILARYRGRYFSSQLNPTELLAWQEFVAQRLQLGEPNLLSLSEFFAKIRELETMHHDTPEKMLVLQSLTLYGRELAEKYSLSM